MPDSTYNSNTPFPTDSPQDHGEMLSDPPSIDRIRCRYLGWDGPILHAVVDQLLETAPSIHRGSHSSKDMWDLRGFLVVLPSALAKRRLTELLAERAQQEQATLFPPRIVTVGSLPEHLYDVREPFASSVVQHLVWKEVLQDFDVDELRHLLPEQPSREMATQWLELARELGSLHRGLAAEQLSFRDVSVKLGADHIESARWQVLDQLQKSYLKRLAVLGLQDIQTSRLRALSQNSARTSKRVLVVGCVDLNQSMRSFLSAIAKQVEIWIAAPESEAGFFDAFGCLNVERWQTRVLPVDENQLYVGTTPADQADLTASLLAELGDRYHVREITLGVPEPSLIPELRHRLETSGLSSRFGPGRSLNNSEPLRLLALISNYLESKSYDAFAALIRHPAFENLLRVSKTNLASDWLASIDKYYQEALPKRIDGFVNLRIPGGKVFKSIVNCVDRWLAKLSQRKPQPMSQFVQPLLQLLNAAYQRVECNLHDPDEAQLAGADKLVADAIVDLRDIPEDIQPKARAADLLDWLIHNLSGKSVPELPDSTAVEMLGWLELAWDDAPVLLVAGMHEGVTPESVNADPFLPNSLRQELGMPDNARRYARDAFAMQVMLQSRRELKFIVGKTAATGDPLVPSRLLMAMPLPNLPGRVLHLVSENAVDCLQDVVRCDEVPTAHSNDLASSKQNSKLGSLTSWEIPKPVKTQLSNYMTVTAFRDYLQCPYRYYLRHVLKLRNEDDALAELGAPQFGVLVHDTLSLLHGTISQSTDEEEVRSFLVENLRKLALERYGKYPAAAVLIQIEQAEMRLAAFARKQAERAEQGWEIRYVETGVDAKDGVWVGTDNELALVGRIDRIDFQPATGRWAIWDYKTSESAKHPISVHWTKQKGWCDLQLPLYRRIGEKLGIPKDADLTFGYIAIPKLERDIGFVEAKFSAEMLADADRKADEVATAVSNGMFWPEEIQSIPFDDYARICQIHSQQVSSPPPPRKLTRAQEPVCNRANEAQLQLAIERYLRPSAEQPDPPDLPPLLIRASAGTGKTFQLTNRLLQIILSEQPLDSILAATFTRKAAGEILHRVMERLAHACLDEAAQQELNEHVLGVDTSLVNCLAALKRLTASIHRLRIGTLDSFFSQVAHTFGLELGLPQGWQPMEPVDEPKFQMSAVGRMLELHDRKKLVHLVRMLAKGATSRQVAQELRRTVNAGFTAFRVTEMEAWDQLPIPPAPSEVAIESALRTLANTKFQHKSADKQLETLHLDASIGDWEEVVSHGIYDKLPEPSPSYYRKEIPRDLIVALEVLAEKAAAELLPIRRNQTRASYEVLEAFNEEHNKQIKKHRLVSFSDVTHFLSKWIHPAPQNLTNRQRFQLANRRLEFRLDCGVRHLLLDEFQDTAAEQWRILEPIATPLANRQNTSIFCVGDTKQAIYGWRGGVAEVFDAVQSAIPNIQDQKLTKSYRSSPAIMEVVNQTFSNLTKHSNFADCEELAARWSQDFPKHETARESLSGYVKISNGPSLPWDIPADERRAALMELAAKEIAELVRQSSASVGVLLRRNADVAQMIAMLRELGVPASQDGGNPLTDSMAVELLLSLLHLGDHPNDKTCLFHVQNSPLNAKLPVDTTDGTVVALWVRHQCSRIGLGRLVEQLARWLIPTVSWWDQQRLEQLIQLAFAAEKSFGGRLRSFEEMVETQRVSLPSEAQVKVMTIHKSKGLEFDAVFLPDLQIEMNDGTSLLVLRGEDPCEPPSGVLRYMNASLQKMLPDDWQQAFNSHKNRKVAESLCLLYVAMTRAKRALYAITRPKSGKSTQEFAAVLQSVLGKKESAKQPLETIYEHGDASWFTDLPLESKTVEASPDALPIRLIDDPNLAPDRGILSESMVHSEAGESVMLADLFTVSQSFLETQSVVLHSLFEQVDWLEGFQPNRDEMRQIFLRHVPPDEMHRIPFDGLLDEFEELLQLGSVGGALSKARYTHPTFGSIPDEVRIDHGREISHTLNGASFAGKIDRLALLYKDGKPIAAELFDFRMDAFDQQLTLLWLEDRIDQYRPQMEMLSKAVSTQLGIPLDRIATYLVMLNSDDLVRLDQRMPDPHFQHTPSQTSLPF